MTFPSAVGVELPPIPLGSPFEAGVFKLSMSFKGTVWVRSEAEDGSEVMVSERGASISNKWGDFLAVELQRRLDADEFLLLDPIAKSLSDALFDDPDIEKGVETARQVLLTYYSNRVAIVLGAGDLKAELSLDQGLAFYVPAANGAFEVEVDGEMAKFEYQGDFECAPTLDPKKFYHFLSTRADFSRLPWLKEISRLLGKSIDDVLLLASRRVPATNAMARLISDRFGTLGSHLLGRAGGATLADVVFTPEKVIVRALVGETAFRAAQTAMRASWILVFATQASVFLHGWLNSELDYARRAGRRDGLLSWLAGAYVRTIWYPLEESEWIRGIADPANRRQRQILTYQLMGVAAAQVDIRRYTTVGTRDHVERLIGPGDVADITTQLTLRLRRVPGEQGQEYEWEGLGLIPVLLREEAR